MKQLETYANKVGFNPLNSTCVVTGGSSGIGKSIINELKKRKAKKIINIDILHSNQDSIDFYECDVGNSKQMKKIFDDIDNWLSAKGAWPAVVALTLAAIGLLLDQFFQA